MDKKIKVGGISRIGHEYFKTVSTMLTSAFGLVAALAWNDLIKQMIERYISKGSGIISQFIYAFIVTTVLVLVTMEMGRVADRFKEGEE